MVYPYEPLKHPNSFRILKLHPGRDDEVVSCNIEVTDLPLATDDTERVSMPLYEAVSYVWGSPDQSHEILVDGWHHQVTTNLWHLLRCFRTREGLPRVLWVDALCINQRNAAERGRQVQMMSSIYRNARSVIAWLGEDEVAVHAVRYLRDYQDLESALEESVNEESIQSIFTAWCNKDYWTRTWVRQEFLLAQNLQLVGGHNFVEWTKVRSWFANTQGMFRSQKVECWLSDLHQSPAYGMIRQRQLNRKSSLQELLLKNRDTTCSVARDKVFALVGLASDCVVGHTIKIDYEKDTCMVLLEVLSFISRSGKDLIRNAVFLAQLLKLETNHLPMLTASLQALKTASKRSEHITVMTYRAQAFQFGEIIKLLPMANLLTDVTLQHPESELHSHNVLSLETLHPLIDRARELDTFWTELSQAALILTSTRSKAQILVALITGRPAVGDQLCFFLGFPMALVLSRTHSDDQIVGQAVCGSLSAVDKIATAFQLDCDTALESSAPKLAFDLLPSQVLDLIGVKHGVRMDLLHPRFKARLPQSPREDWSRTRQMQPPNPPLPST